MAELATGAVNTLLGVIRNEARRLDRVQGDVLFIQEEMESMKSFLANLARTRREEHDEQVRTWMNQVRILANDCNNCLDVYLYRRNPDFHRPRRGLRRYIWWGWAFWWLREIIVQYRAASQLRELKDRARDVGERRMRYGVKFKISEGQSSFPGAVAEAGVGAGLIAAPSPFAAAAEDDEDDDEDGDDLHGDGVATNMATPDAVPCKSTVEDYFKKRIVNWIEGLKTPEREVVVPVEGEGEVLVEGEASPPTPNLVPSIAFVLPGTEGARALAFASNALAEAKPHFSRSVLVDVLEVHWDIVPLRPKEILYYILREMEELASRSQPQGPWRGPRGPTKWGIYYKKKMLLRAINRNIKEMKVDEKFQKMKDGVISKVGGYKQLLQDLEEMMTKKEMELKEEIAKRDLDVLLCLLVTSTPDVAEQDQSRKRAIRTLSALYDVIIQTTAKKLKARMEEVEAGADSQQQAPQQQISFDSAEYERILKEVLPRTPTSTGTSTTKSVEGEIKEMIYKVKDMIQELQEYNKSDKNRETGGPTQNRESAFQEAATKKIEKLEQTIREQMKIKGIVDKIINHLQAESSSKNNFPAERILIILKIDPKYVHIWEETRNTLSLLETSRCFAGAAIVTTTTRNSTGRAAAENFSDLQLESIEYSLVGIYLDTVIQDTRKHMDEDKRKIVRNILEECGQYEFCIKIFTQALIAKPKRSTEELRKLHSILQATPKSLPSIARKVLKFSYSDLPKQHKSCLLYLAIFPPEDDIKIRRSTLIGRWVAEGLITTEDWCWSSSVAEAKKCFHSLINRKFVCPVDIGATGSVKTCRVVDRLVHRFITKIAKKQHIVDARLSSHLARHFSIFNDVRLRLSDKIETFLQKNIHDLPQFSKLKVLDLEGCHCVFKNKGYLKDICSKILMLKYLSLNGTDVNRLPREINNLHELEVLDIRQTKIPASATRHVLLLKLKRLLAGHIIGPSTSGTDTGTAEDFSSVEIPELIEKMLDVEVLSKVKPRKGRDLTDIGKLSQLKKLGVVINKDSHIQYLLKGINDLHHCLRSLSVSLHITKHEGTHLGSDKRNPSNSLESLSISGSGQLLPFLVNGSDNLAKVTLSGTSLKQEDLRHLANLSNLRCVRLWHGAYIDSELTFHKGFRQLKLLIVDSSEITKISFTGGSPALEKIVWSFTKMESMSLSGIDKLPVLKELKLIGHIAPDVDLAIQNVRHEKKIDYKHEKPGNQDQATGNNAQEEDHGVSRCPSFWKVKGRRWRN